MFIKLAKNLVRKYIYKRKFSSSIILDNVIIDADCQLSECCAIFDSVKLANVSVGSYSYVQEKSSLYCADIGPFCSIASNVTIGLIDHPMHMVSTSPVFYDNSQPLPKAFVQEPVYKNKSLRTVIEADVWIGEGVKVCAGVRIGVGSVIGAGSIVTQDIAPYTIAAGVPCRPLKQRFEEDICNRLLATKWWKLSDKDLYTLGPHFVNPNEFLAVVEEREIDV